MTLTELFGCAQELPFDLEHPCLCMPQLDGQQYDGGQCQDKERGYQAPHQWPSSGCKGSGSPGWCAHCPLAIQRIAVSASHDIRTTSSLG